MIPSWDGEKMLREEPERNARNDKGKEDWEKDTGVIMKIQLISLSIKV